jgi:hypothetical protein
MVNPRGVAFLLADVPSRRPPLPGDAAREAIGVDDAAAVEAAGHGLGAVVGLDLERDGGARASAH